jgi:hypothetical protein
MPIIAKDNRKDFTPAPEGLHQAVCVDVVDLGMQETQWGPKQKVRIVWQIETENPETKKPFQVSQQYTLSLNEKSNLRHHLEAWRGRKFTKDELEGFDLEKLIEANAQVQVTHNIADNGAVWANVQAVVPLGKGMVKMRGKEYTRVKDRAETQAHADADREIAGNGSDDDIPF